ncbi:type II toxin-antitoxin system Phd/YefM family antitoxin [Streptomyces sp. NPDC045431]|uniref:type II toxin-antitoxin system Phd/YefM family antitoxin n=1 Tax=Streptomyces sp. NPDC045431 TaxID=3155613 RepID=UPI0033F1F973
MAYEIPVTQARAELADLINRVVYGGEHVVLTRHGKPLVALVTAADLERLKAGDTQEGTPEVTPEEPERIIGTVSSLSEAPSSVGEQSQWGLTAHTEM